MAQVQHGGQCAGNIRLGAAHSGFQIIALCQVGGNGAGQGAAGAVGVGVINALAVEPGGAAAGIPTEASIYGMVEKAMPGRLQNVYCASPGGGKYMAVLQFKKLTASDEGRQRQAALLAFSAFSELKHVFLVDEDVDCFDMNDVLWAMNTRFQGDADIITIPGVRCHPLDPSNDPSCSGSIRDHGIACKTIFDCTVQYDQKDRFKRAQFMDVDPEHWVK